MLCETQKIIKMHKADGRKIILYRPSKTMLQVIVCTVDEYVIHYARSFFLGEEVCKEVDLQARQLYNFLKNEMVCRRAIDYDTTV